MTIGAEVKIWSADHPACYLRLDGTGTTVPLYHPANRIDFAAFGRETTWTVRVLRIVADVVPTSWSFGLKVADRIEHTDGPQFADPKWEDFDKLRTATDVVEKIGWAKKGLVAGDSGVPADAGTFGVVADQTSGLGVSVSRTIIHRNTSHRVYLNPQVTGGTNVFLVFALTSTTRR